MFSPIQQIKRAIREAVDTWKDKTWSDFYGIPYDDMYEFLSDEYVTIKQSEYDHLRQCKEELIQLLEAQVSSMRTSLAQSAMENAISQQLTNSMKDAMLPQSIGGIKFRKP